MARKQGKTGGWLLWWKIGLGVLLVGLFLPHVWRPYSLWYQEKQEVEQVERELADYRARNSALEEQLRRLSTPSGLEVEARRQGWLRKGEKAILLPEH